MARSRQQVNVLLSESAGTAVPALVGTAPLMSARDPRFSRCPVYVAEPLPLISQDELAYRAHMRIFQLLSCQADTASLRSTATARNCEYRVESLTLQVPVPVGLKRVDIQCRPAVACFNPTTMKCRGVCVGVCTGTMPCQGPCLFRTRRCSRPRQHSNDRKQLYKRELIRPLQGMLTSVF